MPNKTQTPGTIDLTPTWGDIGLLITRLALSKEVRAIEAARPEIARAFALASALVAINDTLTDEQQALVSAAVDLEMRKQGQ